jgi:hypothetical protein
LRRAAAESQEVVVDCPVEALSQVGEVNYLVVAANQEVVEVV